VSSAILYLAIVAIWACVLVPAWVRRPHANRDDVPHPMSEMAGPEYPAQAPPPSQSRQQMLRARRRMLTILASMSVLTGGFAFLGLVGWWICLPPAGMLVLYVLLLREVAMADAVLARKRRALAIHEARLVAARQRAYQAKAGWEAEAEPSAQIIDISGRVGDQLYDQYADAAVRAVGD
jgi:hypothetical protein